MLRVCGSPSGTRHCRSWSWSRPDGKPAHEQLVRKLKERGLQTVDLDEQPGPASGVGGKAKTLFKALVSLCSWRRSRCGEDHGRAGGHSSCAERRVSGDPGFSHRHRGQRPEVWELQLGGPHAPDAFRTSHHRHHAVGRRSLSRASCRKSVTSTDCPKALSTVSYSEAYMARQMMGREEIQKESIVTCRHDTPRYHAYQPEAAEGSELEGI